MKKPSATHLKRRCTSLSAWEIPKQNGTIAPEHVWTNRDMDPTPLEDQTWSIWTIMAYWASDTINIGTWETASSILAVGLSWREAIPIMIVANLCVAIPLVLNGAIGAKLHVPFSIVTTSSFGYYLRYFCIVSRAILAMFWLGIQGANGAQCITIMLRAWAPSYKNIPNMLPDSAGITSEGMVSYFLFWIIQLPLLLIHPTKLRWIFLIKIIGAPIAAIATMGWCIHKAGSGGEIFALKPAVTGSEYAWLWLSCMSSVTGSWATLACNIPDFTRYAKSANGQFVQLPFLPIVFTLCGTLGIVTTSCTQVFAGEYMWNPLQILELWLEGGAGGRCAAFFVALAWYIAQVGTNITANSISAANDLTVLFPRWINIKRGCVIAAIIAGWVLVPWKILTSAATFLAFMGGYAIFLGPMAGIMVADYWFVKKQHIDIPALYNPHGRYAYTAGCNWRAAVAFLVPVGPLIPGLAFSINGAAVQINDGIKNLYTFNWLFGFVTSILLYTTLSFAFPAKETLLRDTVWDLEGSATEAYSRASDEECSHGTKETSNDAQDDLGHTRNHGSDNNHL
ncbi:permease [Apiospora kogelbergensis]|uniref:Permease n=1 Tax=Apiospora kogelbergensis TaxID=1337665 RepID=A0AAW0REB7_9PEZI